MANGRPLWPRLDSANPSYTDVFGRQEHTLLATNPHDGAGMTGTSTALRIAPVRIEPEHFDEREREVEASYVPDISLTLSSRAKTRRNVTG